MSTKKIPLTILGLSYSQTQTGAYALVLAEQKGNRRLPVIIGSFEAQAISLGIEKVNSGRPLTHDLFKNFADLFGVNCKEIIIYDLIEGIFYAKLVCLKDGVDYEIDARTSDAIAIAVRFECPIYTFESILSSAGIAIDTTNLLMEEEPQKGEFSSTSLEELEQLLQEALGNEDYERAAYIRDELQKRESK